MHAELEAQHEQLVHTDSMHMEAIEAHEQASRKLADRSSELETAITQLTSSESKLVESGRQLDACKAELLTTTDQVAHLTTSLKHREERFKAVQVDLSRTQSALAEGEVGWKNWRMKVEAQNEVISNFGDEVADLTKQRNGLLAYAHGLEDRNRHATLDRAIFRLQFCVSHREKRSLSSVFTQWLRTTITGRHEGELQTLDSKLEALECHLGPRDTTMGLVHMASRPR
eukprot:FR737787.1.p1 GENE.FR737787.1~~FR737787.1.p1  ORF type:complete len:242 (+),score=23.72 FR737787.1:43-726(+)